MKNFEQIGEVGVDSGQLMVCDPCYIDSQWKKHEMEDTRLLKHKTTGEVYQYRVHFENYDSILLDGKSVNDLIAEGTLIEIENKPTGEFSYNGVCQATLSKKGSGQLNYSLGHVGAGVAFSSGYGDGVYPVYARKNKDGRIVEVRIIMG